MDSELISRSVSLARALKPLNMFITESLGNSYPCSHVADQIYSRERSGGKKKSHRDLFYGSPFAVKDCFSTAGIETTCGSAMLKGYIPPYDATVVEKLKDAGGILFGKTNMDEFSMGSSSTQGIFGPVKNPWTLKLWIDSEQKNLSAEVLRKQLESDWYITGGSSGGSAVAVACDICRIALGSDTGGSVRNPAAFVGVIGLKPTYGLISRHGLIPLVNSLDVPAIFAKNVTDAALALDILSGEDARDSTTVSCRVSSFHSDLDVPISGLRIGLPKEFYPPDLSPEVWEAWNEVANWLEDEAGCHVTEVSMPHIQYSIQCYHVLGECEVASNMARFDGVEFGFRPEEDGSSVDGLYAKGRHKAFNEVVRRRILAGNYFLLRQNYEEYFVQALKMRRLIADDFFKLFRNENEKVDILLTPVTSTDAPLYSEFCLDDGGYDRERQDDYFTQPVNMAGIPAVTVPVKLSAKGLPISLQLISDSFNEPLMLRVAKWIESRAQFPHFNAEDLANLICNDFR